VDNITEISGKPCLEVGSWHCDVRMVETERYRVCLVCGVVLPGTMEPWYG
jgi:hypothetical protein